MITANQLKLFQDGLNHLEITPDEDARGHSERERPFVYHEPSKTLFYTTEPCHHYHIMPKVMDYLAQQHPQGTPQSWVTGDITDPDTTGRDWIKFIGSDNGHYPQSVISFLQHKFGPREVIYNSGDGWKPLPQEYIRRDARTTIANTPRKDRLAEWRWSYDPESHGLNVWEVVNGSPGHFAMTGWEGQLDCVQGRVYLLADRVEIFYWKDRPLNYSNAEKEVFQGAGWDAITRWVNDNKIREMVPNESS